jgi:hypothetical protein
VRVTLTSESAAVAGKSSGVQVLIHQPKTTPPSSSSELSSESEEEKSPTGQVSEGSKLKREESVNARIINLLMEADMDVVHASRGVGILRNGCLRVWMSEGWMWEDMNVQREGRGLEVQTLCKQAGCISPEVSG